ncbi:MAG: hypothetical protein Q7T61_13985 [Caulobacter sp.]|nr:hypothetical protein [Caulobacter sp.]
MTEKPVPPKPAPPTDTAHEAAKAAPPNPSVVKGVAQNLMAQPGAPRADGQGNPAARVSPKGG